MPKKFPIVYPSLNMHLYVVNNEKFFTVLIFDITISLPKYIKNGIKYTDILFLQYPDIPSANAV